MFHLLYRNLNSGKKTHFIRSVYFVVSVVGVSTCNFIFQVGKIKGNQDAFPVSAPLSLMLIT